MNRQKQMDMLKKEYDQVEVPEQALAAVQTGIQKAKQEKRRSAQWKRWGKLAATAAVVTVVALPNLSPQVAMAVADVPVLNKIVQIVTFDRYQQKDDSGNYEANVQTPELTAQGDAQLQSSVGQINAEVQAYAQQMIAQFQKEMEQQGGVYGLDVQYNVVTDTENWFTLQITTLETMASGAQSVQYYNLDKTTGQYVKLSGLFAPNADYIAAISDDIKAQMKARMAEDENQIYFVDTDMPEDDFQQIAADQSFYFNQEGKLVIAFNEYEVAPGYMGCPQFIIEDSVVAGLRE